MWLGLCGELSIEPEVVGFGVNVEMRPAFAGHAYAWPWREEMV